MYLLILPILAECVPSVPLMMLPVFAVFRSEVLQYPRYSEYGMYSEMKYTAVSVCANAAWRSSSHSDSLVTCGKGLTHSIVEGTAGPSYQVCIYKEFG